MSQIHEQQAKLEDDRQTSARPVSARWELIALLVSYAGALLYTYCDISAYQSGTLCLAAFALAFTISTELAYARQRRSWESVLWLGCLWVIVLGCLIGRNHVWGEKAWLFLHLFAVY